MIYREYGSTGVSAIGFGGMRFGKDEDYGEVNVIVIN